MLKFIYNLSIRSQAVFFTYESSIIQYMDLYPHEFTDYVILVKSEFTGNIAISDKLLKSPLLTVWASAIVVFTVARILVRRILLFRYTDKTTHNDYFYILMNTFGLSFGTTSAYRLHSRAEMIIAIFISLFCVLAGIFCAGFLFEQLTVSNPKQVINSFKDLLQHTELELYRAELPGFRGEIFPNK